MNETGKIGTIWIGKSTLSVQPEVTCGILPQPPVSGITGTTLACDTPDGTSSIDCMGICNTRIGRYTIHQLGCNK